MDSNFSKAKQELQMHEAKLVHTVANEEYFEIRTTDLRILTAKLYHEYEAELVTMIASDERKDAGAYSLYYIFSFPKEDKFIGLKVLIPQEKPVFISVTPVVHAANWYEREAQDLFGLTAEGHPDPRPLVSHDKPYKFFHVEGKGVFQVPVGPIHAGIIEPGHFRISVLGERILNLEVRLFYTHRGLEKLCEGKKFHEALAIVERTCGVCSFSHTVSYCSALEKIAEIIIPSRAVYLRTICLELERLYNHIGDISSISAGVAFHFGVSQMAVLKENLQELNEKITGSRFLRGYCVPGGVKYDITQNELENIKEILKEVHIEFLEILDIMLGHEFFISRMTGTGVLEKKHAEKLGVVGPAARASGLAKDVRKEHPHLAYADLKFEVPIFETGDVEARFNVRVEEIEQSFGIIVQCINDIPSTNVNIPFTDVPEGFALGYTESPRGDNYHWVKVGKDNTIARIRIRSASYCNWPAVAVSSSGNIMPDFPLINKSFELCYSCCDR